MGLIGAFSAADVLGLQMTPFCVEDLIAHGPTGQKINIYY